MALKFLKFALVAVAVLSLFGEAEPEGYIESRPLPACFMGKCSCIRGYSYDYSQHACLPDNTEGYDYSIKGGGHKKTGTEQTCRGRSVPYAFREQEGCTEPRETSVQLQVPEGFAFVEPSFVRVKQCTGLSCDQRRHCVPDDDNITVHTYRVKAYKENERGVCKEIEVEEHRACQCQCQDPGCRKNMVVKEDTCECVCDPEKRKDCFQKRNVQWSQATCSCVCNSRSHCGVAEKFDEEKCECVLEDSEEWDVREDYSYVF